MFISVIVTVHNNEKYLEKCLESVAAQKCNDFEIIIIDDGSDDRSADICDEFCKGINSKAASEDVAKVIHMDHMGRSAAANRGLDVAAGEWIWFVDSCDLIVPEAVGSFKERMRMAKGEMYVSQLINIDENGDNPEYVILRENQEQVRIKNEGDLRWHYTDRILSGKECLLPGIRLFNGDIIRQNNIRFPVIGNAYFEDICFLMKYLMFVSRSILLVNCLYCRRNNIDRSIDGADQERAIPCMIDLLEDVYEQAVKYNKKQIMKEYYMVCCSGLKNLIQNKLDELSDDTVCEQVIKGTDNRTIGKHIRKVKKELLSAARADRVRK